MLQITWVDHSDWKILSCFFPVVWGEIWDLVVEFSFVVSAEHGRQFTESWFDMFESYMSAAKSDPNPHKWFASICQEYSGKNHLILHPHVVLIHFFIFE